MKRGLKLIVLLLVLLAPGQLDAQTLRESEAKARAILNEVIQAMGGPAYLNLRDVTCEGRMANYARGDLTGFDYFFWFRKEPDKERLEISKKRNIINVNNGDQGWELDRAGVQDSTPESIAQFKEQNHRDLGILLRHRLNEEGMTLRYTGTQIVDLHSADVIELTDKEDQVNRLVVSESTRLPVMTIYEVADPLTHSRVEEIERYGNYQAVDGVQTPFYLARERNGHRVFEVFFTRCQYNTALADSFFSREALEQVWGKLDKKKKK